MSAEPPTCDRLHCLTLGWEYSPASISIEGGRDDEILRLPVIGILVHAPAGWVLLETGIDPRPFREPNARSDIYPYGLPEFETRGDPLLDAMQTCGVSPADLVAVGVSHLHIDHAGGLRHIPPRVPVNVQRRELDFAVNRAGRTEAYVREDYLAPLLSWRLLDGAQEITPGIDAISTPGHTPGHMSYRIRLRESGTWLFAIDAIDLQRGIDEDRAIGWSADPADAAARRASHELLVSLAQAESARLVPGHCPVTWPALRRPPDGYG